MGDRRLSANEEGVGRGGEGSPGGVPWTVAALWREVRKLASEHWVAGAFAAAAFLAGALSSYALFGAIIALHAHELPNYNLWFETDSVRVFSNLTDRASDHYRTAVHPLSSLLLSTPAIALIKLGLAPETAARLVGALGGGVLTASFFAVCRRLLGRSVDAFVFAMLLLASASFLFFAGVFELYAWGGATILLALFAATIAGRFQGAALVAGSALSLSITVTNWMAGLAASVVRERLPRAVHGTMLAFAIVAGLSVLQTWIYPTAGKFLNIREEPRYVSFDASQRLVEVPRVFFLSSVVIDRMSDARDHVGNPYVSAQRGDLSLGVVGTAAAVLWLGLLSMGAYAAYAALRDGAPPRPLALLVPLLVVAQLGLHLVYGSETFLYSLHYTPLLILLASFSALRWRWQTLAAAALLVVLAGWHNLEQFKEARARANHLLLAHDRFPHTPRNQVRTAMDERPDEYWPRGTGHIPIGLPGTPDSEKGYLEPGGSFSPSVGSFGVSVWARRPTDVQTSDTLPLTAIRQEFVGRDAAEGLGVRTQTPFYTAEWRQGLHGTSTLTLDPSAGAPPLELVFRSAGPAGGRIETVRIENGEMRINDRWRIESAAGLEPVFVGTEMEPDWAAQQNARQSIASADGWGVVRYTATGPVRLSIVDTNRVPRSNPLEAIPAKSAVTITGGDPRFSAALDAQVTQILMGAVGEQSRPGDPVHYPLTWQRDAAYVVAALAQAGRLDAARVLAGDLATRDFFGGFGAEADAPGLALWAMGVVSRGLNDAAFDRAMWPNVYRKAEFILRMARTQSPIDAEYSGPVVPAFASNPELRRVADPSMDGLIVGRMDWHRPRLFVTAVSIRGLKEAARFARLAGESAYAQSWDEALKRLEAAYRDAVAKGLELDNDRTLAVGLDPTGAAASLPDFQAALDANWSAVRTADGGFKSWPLWTYFELAKARQWVRLDQPDRAWATLGWFWDHSPAPGLYTLWESDREENSFGRWETIRGWVKPPHVTPHYWASAEMVLTQIAMLAYVENDEVVVGGGVPASWLEKPLQVDGVVTDAGPVAWAWDGENVLVTTCASGVTVRGGGALAGRKITVRSGECGHR